METTYTLDVEFGQSDGKAHHLRLKSFDTTKTAEEIKAALTKLTKLNLFEKDGVSLFEEVRHAKVIKKIVTPLFDNKEAVKKRTEEPASALLETAMMAKSEPAAAPLAQVQAPVETTDSVEQQIRIPQDLTIQEEWPKPGWLIQTIELPRGINPWEISETQALMLLSACLPAHVSLRGIEVDDKSIPAKLIVTGKLEEEGPKLERAAASNKEPPQLKRRKKRKRLLERIRRRE